METLILNYKDNPIFSISKAVELLQKGEIVAFPTETVYGMGADIWNESAIKAVYETKDRDYSKPMAAHIGNLEQVKSIADGVPELFYQLAEHYLPGPLAIVIKKNNSVSNIVTAGFDTISIRFPKCKSALELINAFGAPLAATSANISNEPSAKRADDIYKKFSGRISAIIDDGASEIGIESTVIGLIESNIIKVFRRGAIDPIDIAKKFDLKII